MPVSGTVATAGAATASQYNNLRYDTPPAGAVMPFAGASVPASWGWLLCYGQAVSRTTYADLFAVISTAFGIGDGSTTFNLPDLRGRFPLGADNMGGSSANRVTDTEADTVGSNKGAETTTVSHTHVMTKNGSNNTSNSGGLPFAIGDGTSGGMSANGTPNIMNPYLTMNYIIKY